MYSLKKTLIFLLLILPVSLLAQKPDSTRREIVNKAYVRIGMGLSAPLGAYGSSKRYGQSYATSGRAFSAGFAIFASPNVGIGLSLERFTNKLNPDNPAFNPELRPEVLHVPDNASWDNTAFLIGPAFSLPFRNFSIDMHFQGGVLYAAYPSLEVWKYDNGANVAKYAVNYDKSSHFAVNTGLQLRLKISDGIFLATWADYLYSQPTFIRHVSPNVSSLHDGPEIRTISALSYCFGIAFGPYER